MRLGVLFRAGRRGAGVFSSLACGSSVATAGSGSATADSGVETEGVGDCVVSAMFSVTGTFLRPRGFLAGGATVSAAVSGGISRDCSETGADSGVTSEVAGDVGGSWGVLRERGVRLAALGLVDWAV